VESAQPCDEISNPCGPEFSFTNKWLNVVPRFTREQVRFHSLTIRTMLLPKHGVLIRRRKIMGGQ
jgi:hypothetical protein